MARQQEALEQFLNTNASSPTYIAAQDNLLYNNGGKRPPDRIKFIIRTVDDTGTVKAYNLDGIISNPTGQMMVGLVLFINPATISSNLAKIVNRTQTMTGWLEEHWGEELDTITFQGSSAAFVWEGIKPYVPIDNLNTNPQDIRAAFDKYMDIPDLGTTSPVGPGDYSGLTVARRRETMAYDEFRRIINLMNANAATFDIYGRVSQRLFIEISYDCTAYRGYFESIDLTEDAASPFRFIYTITFKSEKTLYSFTK
jgi:hypothetical protein